MNMLYWTVHEEDLRKELFNCNQPAMQKYNLLDVIIKDFTKHMYIHSHVVMRLSRTL